MKFIFLSTSVSYISDIGCFAPAGKLMQTFDHSKDPTERELSAMVCSPSGQTVLVGSYDRSNFVALTLLVTTILYICLKRKRLNISHFNDFSLLSCFMCLSHELVM